MAGEDPFATHLLVQSADRLLIDVAKHSPSIRAASIDPHMTPDGLGFRPPVNIQTLIEGVVLHPKASPEFKQEVAKFCAAHGLPPPSPSRMARDPEF
jgi:hypothetical protein